MVVVDGGDMDDGRPWLLKGGRKSRPCIYRERKTERGRDRQCYGTTVTCHLRRGRHPDPMLWTLVENRMGGTDARKTERRSQSCIDNNDDDGVDDGIPINFDSTPMKFLVCARIFSSWGGLGGRGGGGGEEEEEIHIGYH